ncbi:MAG TPA: hypothetical protein VD866_08800 [Urbifossiella sp.]|nr:hypothetical protein [Urbifossiella sp.]
MTAAPATADDVADIKAQLHRLTAMVARLSVPVEVLHTADVARLLGRSVGTVGLLYASGLFTDARPPGRRGKGATRLTYADEVAVYRAEGAAGVRRLRVELGRVGS